MSNLVKLDVFETETLDGKHFELTLFARKDNPEKAAIARFGTRWDFIFSFDIEFNELIGINEVIGIKNNLIPLLNLSEIKPSLGGLINRAYKYREPDKLKVILNLIEGYRLRYYDRKKTVSGWVRD